MVQEDAVEDLGQVRVEVLRHVATNVLGLAQLLLNATQRLRLNAHT